MYNNPFMQQTNPALNLFGNIQNFQQQFNAFAQQFGNQNPQQIVQNMLNNGTMSQQQFNSLSQMANQIMGRNQF